MTRHWLRLRGFGRRHLVNYFLVNLVIRTENR
jgi:hypothetical protein